MFMDLKTRQNMKTVEKELRGLGMDQMLHPRTIRSIAMFMALNAGVPIGSALHGLATVTMMQYDELILAGIPVPSGLVAAKNASMDFVVNLMTEGYMG